MPLADTYLVSPKLEIVPEAELSELESALGFALPVGYREYLRTLGNGTFCHDLHVRTPSEVMDPRNMKYWTESMVPVAMDLWSERPLLDEKELAKSIVFAKSDEGDIFIAGPHRPGQVFELPRHEAKMYDYPDGFSDPFRFEFCKISGFHFPFFEPRGCEESSFSLQLSEDANTQEIWELLGRLGFTQLRVAEGEIGRTDRVVAFIPEIAGCAWLDGRGQGFTFSASADHALLLKKIRDSLAHLAMR